VRHDAAKDGLWKVNGARQVVYAHASLSVKERIEAARKLARQPGRSVRSVRSVIRQCKHSASAADNPQTICSGKPLTALTALTGAWPVPRPTEKSTEALKE